MATATRSIATAKVLTGCRFSFSCLAETRKAACDEGAVEFDAVVSLQADDELILGQQSITRVVRVQHARAPCDMRRVRARWFGKDDVPTKKEVRRLLNQALWHYIGNIGTGRRRTVTL